MKTVGNNIWEELGRREAMIRNEYAKKRIALKPGQGLALALEESNALAANLKSTKSASDAAVQEAVQALHVIYSIADRSSFVSIRGWTSPVSSPRWLPAQRILVHLPTRTVASTSKTLSTSCLSPRVSSGEV
jgi:hypothetical protein